MQIHQVYLKYLYEWFTIQHWDVPVQFDVVDRVDHIEDVLPVLHCLGHQPLSHQVSLVTWQQFNTVMVEHSYSHLIQEAVCQILKLLVSAK